VEKNNDISPDELLIMSIDHSRFRLIRNIKQGERTIVDLVSRDGMFYVKKRFFTQFKNFFHAEVENTELLANIGYQKFIAPNFSDEHTLSIYYPYREGDDLKHYITYTNNIEHVFEAIIDAIIDEQSFLKQKEKFIFVPDGLRVKNILFPYARYILSSKYDTLSLCIPDHIREKVKKLLKNVKTNPVWGKYDPELSNYYMKNPEKQILSIDFAEMILHDSFYPFAYITIHLKQDYFLHKFYEKDYASLFWNIAMKKLQKLSTQHMSKKTVHEKMILNALEVSLYLFSEYIEYAKKSQKSKEVYLPRAAWILGYMNEFE